jgi:hypothetical protein
MPLGGIIELLIILAVIGLVAWALTKLVPMPQPIQTVIIVIAVLLCLLVVVRALGLFEVPVLR